MLTSTPPDTAPSAVSSSHPMSPDSIILYLTGRDTPSHNSLVDGVPSVRPHSPDSLHSPIPSRVSSTGSLTSDITDSFDTATTSAFSQDSLELDDGWESHGRPPSLSPFHPPSVVVEMACNHNNNHHHLTGTEGHSRVTNEVLIGRDLSMNNLLVILVSAIVLGSVGSMTAINIHVIGSPTHIVHEWLTRWATSMVLAAASAIVVAATCRTYSVMSSYRSTHQEHKYSFNLSTIDQTKHLEEFKPRNTHNQRNHQESQENTSSKSKHCQQQERPHNTNNLNTQQETKHQAQFPNQLFPNQLEEDNTANLWPQTQGMTRAGMCLCHVAVSQDSYHYSPQSSQHYYL